MKPRSIIWLGGATSLLLLIPYGELAWTFVILLLIAQTVSDAYGQPSR